MRCNHSYFCSSDFAHLIPLFSFFKEYCSDFAHFFFFLTLKFSQNFSINTKKHLISLLSVKTVCFFIAFYLFSFLICFIIQIYQHNIIIYALYLLFLKEGNQE